MNKEELALKLNQEAIPDDCYCLNGGLPNDRIILNKKDVKWEVYYSERGKIYELREFDTEDNACDFLYHRVKDMLKYM
jgi:hypothetical protein